MDKIKITHFSDVLCIWAYISQIRMDELEQNFQQQVELHFHLFPVFGDIQQKIQQQWLERGGIEAYSEHVLSVANQFEHLSLHPDVWKKNTPSSSLPAHLFLCAIKQAEKEQQLEEGACSIFTKAIRQAFFCECQDVSNQKVLFSLLQQCKLSADLIEEKITSGKAYAVMASDIQMAKNMNIHSSPTLVFNEDRQRLTGNVGYKIIEANIKELLCEPSNVQPWC